MTIFIVTEMVGTPLWGPLTVSACSSIEEKRSFLCRKWREVIAAGDWRPGLHCYSWLFPESLLFSARKGKNV